MKVLTNSKDMQTAFGSTYTNIDLHCHTTESDGIFTPDEILEKAHSKKVNLFSITDHDTIEGYLKVKDYALDLTLLPGVEISVQWGEHSFAHVLAYNFDLDSDLTRALTKIQNDRMLLVKAMDNQLASNNLPRVLDKILEKRTGNTNLITRSEFAIEYHLLGMASSAKDAKEKYFSPGTPGFIYDKFISLQDAIKLINKSNGVAILAHPGMYKFGRNESFLNEFLQSGGTGIEVINGGHSQEDVDYFTNYCIQNNIPVSKGSDYHSPVSKNIELGCVPNLNSDLVPFWSLGL